MDWLNENQKWSSLTHKRECKLKAGSWFPSATGWWSRREVLVQLFPSSLISVVSSCLVSLLSTESGIWSHVLAFSCLCWLQLHFPSALHVVCFSCFMLNNFELELSWWPPLIAQINGNRPLEGEEFSCFSKDFELFREELHKPKILSQNFNLQIPRKNVKVIDLN